MLKKLTAALLVSGLAFTAAPAAGAVATASEPTVVQTKLSDYKKKDRNKYWRAVRRDEPVDARIIGKKDVIGMGVAVCDLLRAGGDIYDLAELAAGADSIVYDLVITTMGAAPVYLCPDQGYKFDD